MAGYGDPFEKADEFALLAGSGLGEDTDLMQLFGDVDVDSLAARMTCESVRGGHGLLKVERIFSGSRERENSKR